MLSSGSEFEIPFNPSPRDFPGHPMPLSVPKGMRLELSRSRLVDGKEDEFNRWMNMLNSRPEELQESLPAERAVFEATFRSVEADGSTWMYHLSLVGDDSRGLDETRAIDAEHAAFSRNVKAPGWEELEPVFMLVPNHILTAMTRWAATGQE